METVVLKTLGDIDGFDTGCCLERSNVKNEFVGTSSVRVCIKDLVVGTKARHDIVGIKKSNLSRVSQSSSTWVC